MPPGDDPVRLTTATSDTLGTILPRHGFFPFMHPPRYQTPIIDGELPGTSSTSETSTFNWLHGNEFWITQTSAAEQHTGKLLAGSWQQTDVSVTRSTDAAYAFILGRSMGTDSAWRGYRRTLAPLRPTADALLEDINDRLERERGISARTKHAGLSAVARLVEALGVTRPTVLRMAGVPNSTFYAWQKNPIAVIRTPTVTRLLQLQAQVAILDEALGRERMRSWLLSHERLPRLQGDDTAFAQVLTEAETALADAIRITPRRRMRRVDYSASEAATEAGAPISEAPSWPGAARIPDTVTKSHE